MKGLLIKDYKLMKNQKGYFIVLLLLCVVFAAREGGESFCVGFITYVCSLFCISTISYDEFDNGNAFLFTLPFTRAQYAMEKYGFGLITGIIAWAVGTLIASVAWGLRHPQADLLTQWLPQCLMLLAVDWIFLSVLIPFQLKFGAEKGRIVLLIILGVVFAAVFAGGYVLQLLNVSLGNSLDSVSALGEAGFTAAVLIIGAVAMVISGLISRGIVEKKEF